MAEATVFVDDAVRGTLPPLCAKEGTPTGHRLRLRSDVGDPAGLGVAWLLLLLGPLGWVGLLLMSAARSRGEHLTVEVPYGDAAYQRLLAARRLRRGAVAVAALMAVITIWLRTGLGAPAAWWPLSAAIGVAAVALVLVAELRLRRLQVGVQLDASRRWVRLHGIHPAFAQACEEQQRARDATRTSAR